MTEATATWISISVSRTKSGTMTTPPMETAPIKNPTTITAMMMIVMTTAADTPAMVQRAAPGLHTFKMGIDFWRKRTREWGRVAGLVQKLSLESGPASHFSEK